MSRVRVSETFSDWDGISIPKGTEGELVLRRFSERYQKHFWNIVLGDRVLAVCLGRPPVEVAS